MTTFIEIEKSLIPYTFNILLANEWFMLGLNYNKTADLFTVDLYKDNQLLCANEPIVYGVPLWQDVYLEGFPALTIIPLSHNNKTTTITYENFGNQIQLIVANEVDT